jgi:hypothetical protein
MRLLYNPKAIAYHHQFFSFQDACQKALANDGAMQLFFQKEAGQAIAKEIQRKQSGVGRRVATALAPVLLKAFSPFRHLLNSPLALPGFVYRLFFWEATRRSKPHCEAMASSGDTQRALPS